MFKDKKRGRKDNNKAYCKTIGTSTTDSIVKREDNNCNNFSSDMQTLKESIDNQTKATSVQNVKDGKSGDGEFPSVISKDIHSETNLVENKSNNTTNKGIKTYSRDNPTSTQSATKSQKKRRKRRKKSLLNTSLTESLTSTEHERDELNSSDSILEKITDYKEVIAARISELEAETNKPKANIFEDILSSDADVDLHITFDRRSNKYLVEDNKNISPRGKTKRKVTFNLSDEIRQEVKDFFSSKESQFNCSNRPVIFMADKATQTNPSQGLTKYSKPGSKNSTTLTDSIATIDSTESAELHFAEELISEDINTTRKKTDMFSSLSSFEDNLQSITEDFVRSIKISNENFETDLIKCLKE